MKMKMQAGIWTLALSATLIVMHAPSASATLLMVEDFDYPDTPNISGTGGWAQLGPGTGVYAVESGKAVHIGNTELDTNRVFTRKSFDTPNDPDTVPVIYSAFTINMSETPAFSNGDYFAGFGTTSSTSSLRARLWASKTSTGTVGQEWRLGVGGSSGSSADVNWIDNLVLGQDYQVVTRYNQATGKTAMWLDPANEADPFLTDVGDDSGAGSRDAYSLANRARSDAPDSNPYGTFTLDNLFIADSFEQAVTGVPEPHSALLTCMSLLAVLASGARSRCT